MPQTDLSVCNLAIVKAGGEAIGAFDENTPLAQLCAQVYPQKRRELLSAHRWVFAKRLVRLTAITPTPDDCPYTYAYAYPSGVVGEFWDFRCDVDPGSAKVPVLQMPDFIASDDAVVWTEFTGDRAEADWPAYFTALVVSAFGADVARAMMRRTLANELTVEAFGNPEDLQDGGLMLKAKQLDGVNAPKRSLEYDNGGPLVAARMGAGLPSLGLLSGN